MLERDRRKDQLFQYYRIGGDSAGVVAVMIPQDEVLRIPQALKDRLSRYIKDRGFVLLAVTNSDDCCSIYFTDRSRKWVDVVDYDHRGMNPHTEVLKAIATRSLVLDQSPFRMLN